MKRRLGSLLTLLLVGSLCMIAPVGTASAASGDVIKRRLYTAIEKLPGARETRRGYDRDKFRHWIDADGDCRDTRDEVLAAESLVRVRGCDVQRGKWRSRYDGKVTRDSTAFDIDHLVALAEAWDSGANRWNAGTRKRFANDLVDGRTLIAVSASSNRSKSDRDPAEWLPPRGKCRYVKHWVAVKIRWRLKVDGSERRALRRQASKCSNTVITVRPATVRFSSGGGGGGTGGGTGTGGLDPRFDYCYQAIDAGYGPYYQGRDPEYGWYTDSDSDGVVCE
jgi:hypothetical protein